MFAIAFDLVVADTAENHLKPMPISAAPCPVMF